MQVVRLSNCNDRGVCMIFTGYPLRQVSYVQLLILDYTASRRLAQYERIFCPPPPHHIQLQIAPILHNQTNTQTIPSHTSLHHQSPERLCLRIYQSVTAST
eukprot:544539-Pelagomonas_calceolata.AAC.1